MRLLRQQRMKSPGSSGELYDWQICSSSPHPVLHLDFCLLPFPTSYDLFLGSIIAYSDPCQPGDIHCLAQHHSGGTIHISSHSHSSNLAGDAASPINYQKKKSPRSQTCTSSRARCDEDPHTAFPCTPTFKPVSTLPKPQQQES